MSYIMHILPIDRFNQIYADLSFNFKLKRTKNHKKYIRKNQKKHVALNIPSMNPNQLLSLFATIRKCIKKKGEES